MKGLLRRTPLRVKLVAAVLALVTAALVVISVGSAVALRSYLIERVDRDLASAAQQVAGAGLVAPDGRSLVSLPSDYFVAVMDLSGQVWVNDAGREYLFYYRAKLSEDDLPRRPTGAAAVQRRLAEPYTVLSRDGHTRWRMLIEERNGVILAVARSLNDVDQSVVRLVWIDVLVGGAVLIMLASLGAAIVRTSLRPLVEIERTAAAIAEGDLTRRVPDPEAGDGEPVGRDPGGGPGVAASGVAASGGAAPVGGGAGPVVGGPVAGAVPGGKEPQTELGRLSRTLNAMLAQIETAFTARAASETAARAAESAARDAAVAAQVSEARARRSEERMRQFVADASHELRTPLTTIRGFAELYRQGAAASAEDGARLVRRIEDEAARMGLLVEDLLLLARLDRERPLNLLPVELTVLAADAVQAARAVAPERSIELDVPPGADRLVVLGDDARLRQVIGNLMTNALTHTPSSASITVRLRDAPGNTALVEVVDTGQGLATDQAERVFERFYRADAARTRRSATATGGGTGTGLGLAIVAAIVAAHRGTVEVESAPGAGATFRVRLPRADPAEPTSS